MIKDIRWFGMIVKDSLWRLQKRWIGSTNGCSCFSWSRESEGYPPQGLDGGARPQYAALAFDDNVTAHMQGRVRDAAQAAFPGASNGLNATGAVQRLTGAAAALLALSQGTPAGRCLAPHLGPQPFVYGSGLPAESMTLRKVPGCVPLPRGVPSLAMPLSKGDAMYTTVLQLSRRAA